MLCARMSRSTQLLPSQSPWTDPAIGPGTEERAEPPLHAPPETTQVALGEDLSKTLVFTPPPGSRITCTLGRRLGIGGFCEVFEAALSGPWTEGPSGSRRVAVKRLLPALRGDPRHQRQLRREGLLGARLNHPNIARTVQLFELHGELGPEPALAMDLVEGMQGNRLLQKVTQCDRRLTQAAIVHVADGLFAALEYLEEARFHLGPARPLVHADVSLENLLVSTAGEVKLIDFGLAAEDLSATQRHAEDALTQLHQVAGKRAYWPPGTPLATPSGKTDLYAAAVCLWELLSGLRFPILPASPSAAEMQSMVAVAALGQPAPIWQLLQACLSVEPAQRPHSATQCRALLQTLPRPDGTPALLGRLVGELLQGSAAAPATLSGDGWDHILTPPVESICSLIQRLHLSFCPEEVRAYAPEPGRVDREEAATRTLGDEAEEETFRLHAVCGTSDAATTIDRAALRTALHTGFAQTAQHGLLFRVHAPAKTVYVVALVPGQGTAYALSTQELLRAWLGGR